MSYQGDLESKKFFKNQWKHPFKRFRKTALPIVVSAVGVFMLMVSFFAFLPWFVADDNSNLMTVLHTMLAVIIGVAVAFFGHLLQLKGTSRFETIRVRIRNKR